VLEIYREIVNLVSSGGRGVLATVISSRGGAPRSAGAKMLVREDSTIIGTIGGGNAEHLIRRKAMEMMGSTEVEVVKFDLTGEEDMPGMICGGQMDVLLEPIVAQETLYLFGAGHISQGVAAMAKRMGFRVVVVDPRTEYNNSEYLPTADSLVVDDYVNAFAKLDVGKNSYVVILTPGHVSDEQCLELAVGTGACYIGMIGSRKKVKEVKGHLLKKGVAQQTLDRVHAPIGLAIGAESPDEIAVSIMAEIVKVRRESS
jgi:xanthine dehydrogenase accessory factor